MRVWAPAAGSVCQTVWAFRARVGETVPSPPRPGVRPPRDTSPHCPSEHEQRSGHWTRTERLTAIHRLFLCPCWRFCIARDWQFPWNVDVTTTLHFSKVEYSSWPTFQKKKNPVQLINTMLVITYLLNDQKRNAIKHFKTNLFCPM